MIKRETTNCNMAKINTVFVFILLILFSGSCTSKSIPAGSSVENKFTKPMIESPLLHHPYTRDHRKQNRAALLDAGRDALLLRIHLIRAARHSIAMQTIIWKNDETGRLLMYELIQAAKRGVNVRLLIDHIASEKHPEVAAFLSTVHPNLKIKLYNPIVGHLSRQRIDPSILDQLTKLLSSFNKINQRMHNKVFIVDNQIGITGGRNNQNAYYDQARGMNYRDRDILVTGPVIVDMYKSFEEFWKFKYSIPIQVLVNTEAVKKQGVLKTWSTREDFAFNGLFQELLVDADNQQIIQDLFASRLKSVENAYFIADDPGKNKKKFFNKFYGSGKITMELARLISMARHNIYINTPYLVLTNPAIKLFKQIIKKHPDIDIRIATNSLAATDSWYCYALSFQQKQVMLCDLKFKIYEFKPLPGDMHEYMPGLDKLRKRAFTPTEQYKFGKLSSVLADYSSKGLQRPPLPGEPYLCLHAKSLVIDDKTAFIGSYNLDPRSENLNTEVGMVIQDRQFAAIVKKSIARDMHPRNSWVIAKNRYPVGLGTPNAILEKMSHLLPWVDPWPLRYAGSYDLKKDGISLDPDHENFYSNYKYVGNFPDVPEERSGKVLGTMITKTLFGFIRPLL